MAKQTNEEFLLDVLRLSIDHNSQVMSIASAELAGDPSGRNKTRQKKVIGDLQMIGSNYAATLDMMYNQREHEQRLSNIKSKYDPETEKALRRVLSTLESSLSSKPDQQLVDTANYIEMMLLNKENDKELKPIEVEGEKTDEK